MSQENEPSSVATAPEIQKTRNKPAANVGKTVSIAVAVAIVCGLGGTIYFLLKEKSRSAHNFEAKLAQLESRVQTLQNSIGATASAQSVEALRRDLQNFKEQTTEQFIKEEKTIQELRNVNAPPASSQPQQNIEEPPPATPIQPVEIQAPPVKPVEVKREPPVERSKEAQGFVDFIEALAKNFYAIAKEVFQKVLDLIFADKRPPA